MFYDTSVLKQAKPIKKNLPLKLRNIIWLAIHLKQCNTKSSKKGETIHIFVSDDDRKQF